MICLEQVERVFQVGEETVYALLSGLLHFLYWLWLSRSLDEGDLSRVYPISRSAPALVFVIAVVFMGEDVSVSGAVGILLAALGVYTISLSRLTPAALLQPLPDPLYRRCLEDLLAAPLEAINLLPKCINATFCLDERLGQRLAATPFADDHL